MATLPPSPLEWIREQLDRIAKRLDTIEATQAASVRTLNSITKGENCLARHVELNAVQILELASTVGALKQRVFPELQRDLDAVEKIVGVDFSDPLNPLDRRKSKKSSAT